MKLAHDQTQNHSLGPNSSKITATILRTLIATCSVLSTAACTGEEAIVEPAFEAGSMVPGPQGYFEPYVAGDEMLLVNVVHSGLWLLPTLRYQGMAGSPEISCIVIDLDQDLVLADRAAHLQARELDGWLTLPYFMEPIVPGMTSPQASDLETYLGDRILFECSATDEDGFTVSLSQEMRLAIY